jgi:hypothetical protein
MGRHVGIKNPFDARSTRGIMSRGRARYGVSNSPKPGNLMNIQKAAQARVKKMQNLNDRRQTR